MTIKKYSFITIFIYGLALFSPVIFRNLNLLQTGTQPIMALTVIYVVAAVVLILLYFKNRRLLEIEKKPATASTIIGLGILGIFLAIFLQITLTQIEASITGKVTTSANTQNIVSMLQASPLFLLAVSIAGPVMEEFAYRRALLGFVANYSNYWIGAIVSSIIFALAHGDGHLLIYFSLGFFLTFLYHYTGSIWTSVMTHAGMNTIVMLVQILLR